LCPAGTAADCPKREVWADLSVEMSEVALLVAEGVWEDLLQDTAETIASLEEGEQRQGEVLLGLPALSFGRL
jgi:hypothetical protein